jgi:hypothetical protein
MSETPSRFATCIGVVVSGREVSVRHEGRVLSFGRAGFDHFAP